MREPEGEGWIQIEDAMAIADRSRTQLNQLAREGKLTRWQERAQKGFPAWFREDEIRRLADSHTRRRRERRVAKREADLADWRDLGYYREGEETLSCRKRRQSWTFRRLRCGRMRRRDEFQRYRNRRGATAARIGFRFD